MEWQTVAIARKFQTLVDFFTVSGELMYYDTRDNSLMLKRMPNNSTDLMMLRRRIHTITGRYKMIFLTPLEMTTHIKILNIK